MKHQILLLLVLATVLPQGAMAAVFPPAGVEHEGRDDVAVSVDPRVQIHQSNRGIVVDSNGRVFVAFEVDDPITGAEIHVMRSTDDGENFYLWARRATNDGREMHSPSLTLVPGSPERIALAYQYDLGEIETFPYYQNDVNVAVARTDAYEPTWTVRTVFSAAGEDILGVVAPDVTAAMGPNGPVIYVVAKRSEWNGQEDSVYFSRSLDLGANWDSPYAVKPTHTATTPYWPRVAADDTGDVFVVWQCSGGSDGGAAFRSASTFAAHPNDWDPSWTYLDTPDNDWFATPVDVAAQSDGSGFVVVYGRYDNPDAVVLSHTMVWDVAGHGGDWDLDTMPDTFLNHPRVEPMTGGGWIVSNAPLDFDDDHETWSVLRSNSTSDPQFDTEIILADTWAGAPGYTPAVVAAHPEKDAFAMMWMDDPFQVSPVVRFDATWWSGPGAPSLVDGFPKALPATPRTHPAVVDVSARSAGDEIVYADSEGLLHVVDHLGNDLPGWPQSIGDVQKGQAVAVGDIDGDGGMDIVAPNASGEVYVFDADGTLQSGWPVDLGVRAAHVTLAPVSKLSSNDVVAVCGTQAFLLRSDATEIPYDHWPVSLSDLAGHASSVGDLDGDGSLEVVVTTGDDVQVFDARGNLIVFESTGDDPFSAPASLGDLDRDGDLEIVATTHGGFVHALHHDGTVVAGQWPLDVPGTGSVVGATIANLDGSGDPEIVVTSAQGLVVSLESDGTESVNWPAPIFAEVKAPAIVDDIDGFTAEVLFATETSFLHARHADGTKPFAWPAPLADVVELSTATGDVDGDGELDLIVLTVSSLVRYDLNNTVGVDAFLRWTQFGHDARRTHCTTGARIATGVESPGEHVTNVRIAFAPPAPNPVASGGTSLSFSLPQSARARLDVFDARGRKVRTVADGDFGAGTHTLMWDVRDASGQDVSSGTYYGRLVVELPDGTETVGRKMSVVR